MLWPLGRYCRIRPLVFSLVPRSHMWWGVRLCLLEPAVRRRWAITVDLIRVGEHRIYAGNPTRRLEPPPVGGHIPPPIVDPGPTWAPVSAGFRPSGWVGP